MGALPAETYYPPPESQGGWRCLEGDDAVRSIGGMDPEWLDRVLEGQHQLWGGDSWAIVIVRGGYLVREAYTFNVLVPTRFDIWSGTKSFTGTAWGLLLDDSRCGRLPPTGRMRTKRPQHPATWDRVQVDLDSPAYPYIPEGYPLTDERKAQIRVRHLLTMTSGIPGEKAGVVGIPTATNAGPFEHALGRCANRYGRRVDTLYADPGAAWDYSDPAMAHLALAFAHITGREMADVMQERVFAPIGIESLSWDVQGGSGFLGPHTNAHTGIHVSARELARFGYLALHGGQWAGRQIVPEGWMQLATRSSQNLNLNYGYTWWVNGAARWPDLPQDAFALSGYRCNRCYVVPSLDLVVARVGSGPAAWDDNALIGGIVGAIR
jgi:CubicO group peptidase (beta-lactamase class C family)